MLHRKNSAQKVANWLWKADRGYDSISYSIVWGFGKRTLLFSYGILGRYFLLNYFILSPISTSIFFNHTINSSETGHFLTSLMYNLHVYGCGQMIFAQSALARHYLYSFNEFVEF